MIIKETDNMDYKDVVILNIFKKEMIYPYSKIDPSIHKRIIIFENKNEVFKIRNNNCYMKYNNGIMVFNDFDECYYLFKLKKKDLNLESLIIKEDNGYILIKIVKKVNSLFKVKVKSIF